MMSDGYLTKVLFDESIGYGMESRKVVLNIPMKELAYEVSKPVRKMPAIQGTETVKIGNYEHTFNIAIPAVFMKNGKNNFKPVLIHDDQDDREIVFSYGIKLTDQDVEALLPYCVTADFEAFIGKEMERGAPGYIGYRDEAHMSFVATCDSANSPIELPMDYYFDEEHIWPSEKLYRYIVKTFFEGKKKLRGWGPCYGGLSLFY